MRAIYVQRTLGLAAWAALAGGKRQAGSRR